MRRSTRRRSGGLPGAAVRGLGSVYRVVVTSGRWVMVAFWIAAVLVIQSIGPSNLGSGGGFGDLLPPTSRVLQVEAHILTLFRVPVVSGTTVVVHQPGGLSLLTRADSVLWAAATTKNVIDHPEQVIPGQVVAAIPVPTGASDTTVTYLYMSEGTGLHNTVRLANGYAAHFHNQAEVSTYVTGFVPAQVAQSRYLSSRLGVFEIASVLLILLVVALAFRSVVAPLAVIAVAAVGYLIYLPSLNVLAGKLGFTVPAQLEPVLLALLLGVVTDYCVLFFSAFRDELDEGLPNLMAARAALSRNGSVVAVAGLTVAGGTIALLAAPFAIFRGLGPALALTVLIGLGTCLTLTPALMTILGWRLFTALPVRGFKRQHPHLPDVRQVQGLRERAGLLIRLLTRRVPAAVVVLGTLVVLALAAVPLAQARLDLSFTAALPPSDSVAVGAQLLQDAGLRGISAPTEVLVEGSGIGSRRADLERMQQAIVEQPGVARVLGPADYPFSKPRGIVLSENGDAARFIVIYNSDPLAAEAITNVRVLQRSLPQLIRNAGLGDATVSITGQSLIASDVANLTRESLEIVIGVALFIELLILMLYLRALIAPFVLLACSALSVAAALGLTTWVFQDLLGEQGLTFYAPFSSAVLLIALGSDYNVFAVGSIWKEAKHRPLADALIEAVPRTSKAITTAGLILAATFALVAIIPLSTFRQIAFAMTVGLLLDTLLVRPLLTPAVLTLLGPAASWPSKRIHREPRSESSAERSPRTSGSVEERALAARSSNG